MSGSIDQQQSRLTYRRLRAPKADGEVLIEPPVAQSQAAIARNRRVVDESDRHVDGVPLAAIFRDARSELLQASRRYTASYTSVPPSGVNDAQRNIYIVGHQPGLFHPGVWLKNFVLDHLAKRDEAIAVHVLIDNDVATDASVIVPSLAADQSVERNVIPLDRQLPPTPWEERPLEDAACFSQAGERIAEKIGPLVKDPLATILWQDADEWQLTDMKLGQQLARMRHLLERAWGLETLEVPLSTLCQTNSFRWFVSLLFSQLPRFHTLHNELLGEYRELHRLRSLSHPVPARSKHGEALESPLWIWDRKNSLRRKLFVEGVGDELVLSDGQGWSTQIASPQGNDLDATTSGLAKLEAAGVKIRPRALTTTMYLRVMLSDYFIHGIGGAKYDQITDRLIEDLFGFPPPAYMTVSGTRLLPVPRPDVGPATLRELDRRLRDIEFHPEKELPDTLPSEQQQQAATLLKQKQRIIENMRTGAKRDAREQHVELARINAELRRLTGSREKQLRQQKERTKIELENRQGLDSREFSFCLFPETALRRWLLDAAVGPS